MEDGFVYLKDIDDSIIVDLKYYSNENFTGQYVEGYLSNNAILTKESALALSDAQDDFNKLGYSLILYDAYRPQRAVDFFIQWSNNSYDTINKRIYYPNFNKSECFSMLKLDSLTMSFNGLVFLLIGKIIFFPLAIPEATSNKTTSASSFSAIKCANVPPI